MFSSRVALIVPVGLGDTTKSDDFLKKTLPKALRTQALTTLTSNFG